MYWNIWVATNKGETNLITLEKTNNCFFRKNGIFVKKVTFFFYFGWNYVLEIWDETNKGETNLTTLEKTNKCFLEKQRKIWDKTKIDF